MIPALRYTLAMDKVVLITGASSGLGKELAKLYLKKGYKLILSGQREEEFEDFKNNSTDIVVGNLTKPEILEELVRVVKEKCKKIDILINNAGITYIQPFEENTKEQLDKIIEIDLKVPMLLTKELYPLMIEQKSGHIININSTAGKEGKANHSMYSAAKFGLAGFTQALRTEAKKYGIRVTSVHPGGIKTALYDNLKQKIDASTYMDPKAVAEIIFFLSETQDMCPDEILLSRM